jgi:uncharacterized membrane protein YphA (DoxX/SURF4 family)
MSPKPLAQFGLTVLRVVIGVVFLMHGWQKVFQNTIPGTQAGFAAMGIPAAESPRPRAHRTRQVVRRRPPGAQEPRIPDAGLTAGMHAAGVAVMRCAPGIHGHLVAGAASGTVESGS